MNKKIETSKILKIQGKEYRMTLGSANCNFFAGENASIYCEGYKVAHIRHNGDAEGLKKNITTGNY